MAKNVLKISYLILSTFLIAFLLTGCVNTSSDYSNDQPIFTGFIQEKIFQKGEVSTGYGMTYNGKMGLVTTSTSDKYIIFVNDEDYEVPKETWLYLEKGDHISYTVDLFGIGNIKYYYEGENGIVK